ncbi:hypothetical protein CEF21_21225 [Bacillus sp. FJAT-42376]|nr:hypothetical protein CEF21_21225 [Bacillus sp. FJAT-42376]
MVKMGRRALYGDTGGTGLRVYKFTSFKEAPDPFCFTACGDRGTKPASHAWQGVAKMVPEL